MSQSLGSFWFGMILKILTLIFQLCTLASVLLAADPGAQLPIFRRPQAAPASPPKAAPQVKSDIPEPIPGPPKGATQGGVSTEQTAGAEVDVAEVIRRGDHVTRAGRGPMGTDDRVISDTTSPPPDDSHKWFISIVTEKGDKESEALLYDLRHSLDLRAWANLDEPKDSWSHVTVYVKGDESQDWRWKNIKITRYPVMILQPPAKLMDESKPNSWLWGDPKTVVWQWDGYDATQPDRAKIRADGLRKVAFAYASKINSTRERFATNDRPTPGPKQASGKPSDNTGAPVFPQLPTFPGQNPVATDPTQPSAPTQVPTDPLGALLSLGRAAFGSGGFWIFILVGLKVWELFAATTPSTLDDQIVAFFRSAVTQMQAQQNQGPKSPTNSP